MYMSKAGVERRVDVLQAVFPNIAEAMTATMAGRPRPGRDDRLHAAAAAWTARQLVRGDADCLGASEDDATGYPMNIWVYGWAVLGIRMSLIRLMSVLHAVERHRVLTNSPKTSQSLSRMRKCGRSRRGDHSGRFGNGARVLADDNSPADRLAD